MKEQQATEPAVREGKADRAARQYFTRQEHAELLAVIEKHGKQGTADVSIFERTGKRITVTVPDNDYLEAGAQSLAARFSGARYNSIHI